MDRERLEFLLHQSSDEAWGETLAAFDDDKLRPRIGYHDVDEFYPEQSSGDDLEKGLGWHVEMETGVSDLIDSQTQSPSLLTRVLTKVSPFLDRGPLPGLWRKQQLARQRYHRLFEQILEYASVGDTIQVIPRIAGASTEENLNRI